MKVSKNVRNERGDWTLQKFLKIVSHFPRHFLELTGLVLPLNELIAGTIAVYICKQWRI